MDTLFHHSPVTTNTQGNIANVTNERQIYSDILEEMIKWFNGLTIQSIINNSEYYDSEEYDAESDPSSDPKLATHTTNQYSPHKLLINRLIPEIIPVAVLPIEQTIAEYAAGSGETLHVRRAIISK